MDLAQPRQAVLPRCPCGAEASAFGMHESFAGPNHSCARFSTTQANAAGRSPRSLQSPGKGRQTGSAGGEEVAGRDLFLPNCCVQIEEMKTRASRSFALRQESCRLTRTIHALGFRPLKRTPRGRSPRFLQSPGQGRQTDSPGSKRSQDATSFYQAAAFRSRRRRPVRPGPLP